MNELQERTIALAGLIQSCAQVQAVARTGEFNEPVVESSIQSVLILDALNTAAVYGGLDGVSSGLRMISTGVLDSPNMEDVELIRYAMSLILLQNQLYRDEPAFAAFGEAVEQLSRYSGAELVDACSQVYQKHISDMRPQIIVQGEQGFLQRRDVPPKVRALLLAGLRSAVLWRQKGGSRLKLLWERRKYRNSAKQLLSD